MRVRHVMAAALLCVGGSSGPSAELVSVNAPDGERAHYGVTEFSPDGATVFLTRSNEDFSSTSILVTSPSTGSWPAPSAAPFADPSADSGGSLSADRDRLYFTSRRMDPEKGIADPWNLWVVERDGRGWGAPAPLPSPVNTEHSECCVTAKARGALYFSSDRDGSWDIYRAEVAGGRIGRVTKLTGAINTKHGEWPSYVDPRERFLLFSSIRPDGHGGDDVYVSFREGASWGAGVNLGSPVNTDSYEDSAVIAPDGKHLYFSSRRETGLGRVFRIPVDRLAVKLDVR